MLIATTGPDHEAVDRQTQHDTIVDVLSRVAPKAEDAGVTIALEPLNTSVDHPGYYLTSTAEAVRIVDEVGSLNVNVLYDVYHQQITESNLIATVREHVDAIGHVHVVDVQGRHQPGTGGINYANVFDALDGAGYDGYVGCEFSPIGSPNDAIDAVFDCL